MKPVYYTSLGEKMKRFFSLVLIFISALVLVACKKAELTINDADKTLALNVGQSVTVTPVLTEGFTLTWTSSKPSVVTVTPAANTLSAQITAVGEGSATITVAVEGKDVSATITVTVVKPDPVSVNVTGAGSIVIGGTLQLTGTVTPAEASQTLVWSSSSVAVATVNSSGLVTAVAEGVATIKAMSVLTSVFKEVTITVVKPDPTGVTVTGPDEIVLGATATLTATVAPALASQGVIWSTSAPTIATVSNEGVVTALALGTVTITAKASAKPTVLATKEITIIPPDPTAVTVNGPLSVAAGKTATYSAEVTPATAVQTVKWSVNDVTKATIDENTGVLTAVASGTVKVIATSTALNTVKGELTVTVTLPDANIELSLNGGYWPITKTDPFVMGEPVKTLTAPGRYNSTTADYYVSATEGAYLTSFFLNDEDYKMAPGVWCNRIFLNRNSQGFFEIEKVVLAGGSNANPTLTDYEYAIFAHSAYAAGYDFIGGLSEGDIITLNGFNMESHAGGFDLGQVTINVYSKSQAVSTAYIVSVAGAEVTLPVPAKENFVFGGWYANAEFTGDPVVKTAAAGKLYAKWEDKAIPLTALAIEGAGKATMGINNNYSVVVTPTNATNPNVVWTISDSEVATISATGVLTPVKEGTVTLTATSVENGEIVATKEVVIYGALTSIAYQGGSKLVVGGVSRSYGVVATNGKNADQTAVTYSSSNPEVFTVDETGKITAVAVGTANYVITSTINNTITKTQAITVISTDDAASQFPLGSVVVAPLLDKESLYFNYLHFAEGYNAFKTIAAAMEKVADNAMIYVLPGTYADAATIAKNNLTFTGGGTISGKLSVAANVKGLTIDGLKFTGAGSVELNVKGGIEDFTFKNNQTFKSTDASTIINFKNDGTAINKNISILNNRFEIGGGAGAARYIRGGNVQNLTIIGNYFEGIKGKYVDGIRIEGTNECTAAGIGVSGVLTITNNVFDKIGQRAIWIRRYSTTKVDILFNKFYSCGDQTYGGGVQLEVWVTGQTTVINFKYNRLENMTGSFGLRLNNTGMAANATWSVNANYNKFIDFILPATGVSDDIIQAYSEAAKVLINADYNLFMRNGYAYDPDDTVMPFVGTYQHRFVYEEDLDLAIILDQADPEKGVVIYHADLETEKTWASYPTTDTVKTLAGMEWVMNQVLLNPDANDKSSANLLVQGSMMLRFRGANTAYMFTNDFVSGIKTLTFDAKYYSSANNTAILKVSILKEGETTWTEVATVPLTLEYANKVVPINEAGRIKIRIEATVKSVNVDNIKLYQTAEVFEDNFYKTAAPDASEFYVYSALASLNAGDRVIYQGKSYYFGTNAFSDVTGLNGKLVANKNVYFGPGEYAGDLTIDKSGVALIGPNFEKAGTATKRNAEAVLKGKITIAKELQDITISGFKFTDNAQVVNTKGTAGTAAIPTINVKNFLFTNNIVESNLASGTAFLHFTESANSYTHNFKVIDNKFKTTNAETTLAHVIYIDNNAGLTVTGNVFKDVKNGAFKLNDTTKGLAGNTLFANNEFTNVGADAINIGWLSALPGTTMEVEVKLNTFTNIGGIAIYFGKMNNVDIIDKMDIVENTFTGVNKGVSLERVTKTSNTKVNLNTFNNIPTDYYIRDGKSADASVAIPKLDAKDNIYKSEGLYIAPAADKFVGEPDFSTKFVTVELNFVVYDGTSIPVQNVLKGFTATKPADPTKVGYNFAGWFTDEALTKVFDFATPIEEATTLYAKWTAVVYTVTYNLNDGYWRYPTKDAMIVDFLTDLYAFVKPTESLSDFMHGTGKTTGYDGLWHSNADYKTKIYEKDRPTEVNEAFFASSTTYMAKWLPFFDMIEQFILAVNPAQHFWGDTFVGYIRIRQYIINVKPASFVTDETMAMMPWYGSAVNYTIATDDITLVAPKRDGFVFGGWYANAELTGPKVTKIAKGSTGNVALFARWNDSNTDFTVTYVLNDGYWRYPNKEAMLVDFLTDLYAFVQPTESLSDFIHGVGKTTGFNGLWYSNATYKGKIYTIGARPEEPVADSQFFYTSPTYYSKWISFFDNMEAFTKAINATQSFYASTYTGLLRLNAYMNNTVDATYTAERLAMVPYYGSPKTFKMTTPDITLLVPLRDGHTFGGWYTNPEFTGTAVTVIASGTADDLTLYAKWNPIS